MATQIYSLLWLLKISEWFVDCIQELFWETGDIDQLSEGRLCTEWMKKKVEKVYGWLNKTRVVGRRYSLNRWTCHIEHTWVDLGQCAYKEHTGQLLTLKLKAIKLERNKSVLRLYGKEFYWWILFIDKKIFPIEKNLICKMMCLCSLFVRYSNTSTTSQKTPFPYMSYSSVERGGVSWNGATLVHFCESGIKINVTKKRSLKCGHACKWNVISQRTLSIPPGICTKP